MKKSLLLIALSVLVLMSSAGAATITVFNTGAGIAPGAVDPNYTLTTTADATNGPGPAVYAGNPIPSPWLADNVTSQWDTPNTNGNFNLAVGTYVYTQTFTLAAGYGTAQLSGQWATDNDATMMLNGNLVSTTPSTSASFTAFTPFSTSNPAFFVTGTNTLTYTINNSGQSPNPTGLRVEISGSTNAVPEPTSLACVGAGLIALGGFARRLRASRR
jgi:hypothetical protein